LRFAPTILAYLSQQVPNLQDAEDLLLEVFMAALKYEMLANLPEERQLAWLRRVARNKVIDRYRHTALLTFLPLEQVAEMEDSQLSPEVRSSLITSPSGLTGSHRCSASLSSSLSVHCELRLAWRYY
jgi:DNA-directed RNA polymerase specialized sigma24 family protein